MNISYKSGKGDKIHISIDGEYRFTVDSNYWFASPYCSLKEIPDEDEDEFVGEISARHAYLQGLRLLSYGDHSKKDLIFRLRQKGNSAESAKKAADKLEHFGYIDDERYAHRLCEKLLSEKHMSLRGIESELFRKGIKSSIIDDVISEQDVDPCEEITELVNKKYLRYLGDEKGKRRTVNALLRLGYSYSDIKQALGNISPEEDFWDE